MGSAIFSPVYCDTQSLYLMKLRHSFPFLFTTHYCGHVLSACSVIHHETEVMQNKVPWKGAVYYST